MKFKKQKGTAKMEVDGNAVKAENGSKKRNLKRKSNEASREVEVEPKMKKIEVIKPKMKTGVIKPKMKTGVIKPKMKTGEVKPKLKTGVIKPKMKTGEVKSKLKTGVIKPKMKTGEVKSKLKKREEVSTPISKSKKMQKRMQMGSKAVVAQEKEDKKVPDFASEGLSIAYLKLWKNDRPAWKYKSIRQQWLINNILDESKVPDEIFPVFIEYMGGGADSHKQRVVRCAKECLVKEEEEDSDDDDENTSEGDHKGKKYDRARMIIQSLDSEELVK